MCTPSHLLQGHKKTPKGARIRTEERTGSVPLYQLTCKRNSSKELASPIQMINSNNNRARRPFRYLAKRSKGEKSVYVHK